MSIHDDLWFVRLAGRAVRAWDLAQLDAALVRRGGTPRWQRLGDFLDESETTVESNVASARLDALAPTVPGFRVRRAPPRARAMWIAAAAAMACAALVSLVVDGAHATPARRPTARATRVEHVLVVHRDARDERHDRRDRSKGDHRDRARRALPRILGKM
jgi:hypothetical protein